MSHEIDQHVAVRMFAVDTCRRRKEGSNQNDPRYRGRLDIICRYRNRYGGPNRTASQPLRAAEEALGGSRTTCFQRTALVFFWQARAVRALSAGLRVRWPTSGTPRAHSATIGTETSAHRTGGNTDSAPIAMQRQSL
jgi:hypothetical protein